uniref:Uncharacterized protein n=1 Tax=Anguilla anguilla TaxID=7936 RepID=A0A0E9X6D6_ANGAN
MGWECTEVRSSNCKRPRKPQIKKNRLRPLANFRTPVVAHSDSFFVCFVRVKWLT